MWQLFKNILGYALFLLIFTLFLGGFILLSWWFDWPLFMGVVIICVLAAIVVLWYAGYHLRLIWNKRRYVQHVLTADPARQVSVVLEDRDSLDLAWQKGLEVFTKSPQRVEPIYGQAWSLLLGQSGSGHHSLATSATRGHWLEESSPELLQWHFLPDLILLETGSSFMTNTPESQKNWEELLTKLIQTRKKEPLNSIIVTVDAQLLLAAAAQEIGAVDNLRHYARLLQGRIQDILTLFEARVPVTVMVTKLDVIPGMTGLLSRLPINQRTQILGTIFPNISFEVKQAKQAVTDLNLQLNKIILELAGAGQPPVGDDLYALSSCEALAKGLAEFLEPLSRQSPHRLAPTLRGIIFSSVCQTNNIEPVQNLSCFIADFFTRQLPKDRLLYQPVKLAPLRDQTILCSFLGWYLFLFAICGLAAANTIYNWQSLQRINTEYPLKLQPESMESGSLDDVKAISVRLQAIENAQHSWWLPSLGLNRLGEALGQTKAQFVKVMQAEVLPPILADITKRAHNNETSLGLLQRLFWLQEAVSLRQAEGSSLKMREQTFPAAYDPNLKLKQDLWSVEFGDMFLWYLEIADSSSLEQVAKILQQSMRQALGENEKLLFERIVQTVNTNLVHTAIGISRFWPQVPGGSQQYMAVSAAYTAAGYAEVRKQMERLNFEAGQGLSFLDRPVWKNYLKQYAAVWRDFACKADQAWQNVMQVSVLQDMSGFGLSKDPYFMLLRGMAKELQPLQAEEAVPNWMQDLFIFCALLDSMQLFEPGEELGTLNMLYSLTKAPTAELEIIREYLSRTRNLTRLVRALTSLRGYIGALQDLQTTMFNAEGSLELARIEFGGKAYGDPEQTSYALANKFIFEAFKHINSKINLNTRWQASPLAELEKNHPLFYIATGPLRFLSHGITVTAAMQLQNIWTAKVMAPGFLLPEATVSEQLFGKTGLVTTFEANQGAPFMTRNVNQFVPLTWNHNLFPFTKDFLDFLQQGQVAGQVAPQDSYEVILRSQTSNVNPDALERLQFYTVELHCKTKVFTLKNQNYPQDQVFTYRPGDCGEVVIGLSFPSLNLRKVYPDFITFLNTFASGQNVLTVDDFPDAAARMDKLGIRDIVLRILPDNINDLMVLESIEISPLPERITEVW